MNDYAFLYTKLLKCAVIYFMSINNNSKHIVGSGSCLVVMIAMSLAFA